MSTSNADRNLLFGILALQMDFISREQLVAGMNAWVLDKSKPLGKILLAQGALSEDTHPLLAALVEKHLQMHGNNAEQSLAAVSSIKSVRDELKGLRDTDIEASLAHVTLPPPGHEFQAGQTLSVGSTTSDGQRFRILRPHAKGGLGEVYVAQDLEVSREVALKEIQSQYSSSPDSRARFLLEAEITGGLEHPGIVPVYGLGQYADGRPFYAMRFIRGDSLSDAIDRFYKGRDSALASAPSLNEADRALEFRKLLGRFVDVCNAIEYAHSRGVLHRDLKPGNIMLGKYGETLVVDWGLAKSMSHSDKEFKSTEAKLHPSSGSGTNPTQMGSAIGTPAYMSPEQAAGRLDQLGPASDVYSLGATLYCLLTGRPPVTGNDVGVVLQKVQQGDFPRPRDVNPKVPAALAAICLKALALKPSERYPTPRALADDVEQWLADEPVSAYREPLRARLARWGRRHKTLVTSVAVLLIAAVAALAVDIVLLGQKQAEVVQERNAALAARDEAAAERRNAQQAKEKAEAISNFLIKDLLAVARPEELGRDVSVKKALDTAALRLDTAFPQQPELEAAVRLTIGDTYRDLGLFAEAEPLVRRALEIRRERLAPEDPDTLTAINSLALLLHSEGKLAEAEALFRQNLETRRRVLGPAHPETLISIESLAWTLQAEDKLPEAELLLRESLDTYRRSNDLENREALVATDDLAQLLQAQGKWDQAEPLFRQNLATRRRVLGPEHPHTLISLNNLALLLQAQGKWDEAERLFRQTAEINSRVLGSEHPESLTTAANLARVLQNQGEWDEAERMFREILDVRKRVLGLEHPATLGSMFDLAGVLFDQGKLSESELLHRQTLEIRKRVLGMDHSDILASMNNLAAVLHSEGKLSECESLIREVLEINRRVRGPEHSATLTAMSNLAVLLHKQDKLDEAEPLCRECLEIKRRVLGAEHPITLWSMNNLARLLADQGQLDEAEAVFRETLQLRRKILPPDHPEIAASLAGFGNVLTQKGQTKEAEPILRECLAICQKSLPAGDAYTGNAESLLGGCLAAMNRYEEAEPLLLTGYETLKTRQGAWPADVRKALDRVVKLYETWDKPDKATEWKAKRDTPA